MDIFGLKAARRSATRPETGERLSPGANGSAEAARPPLDAVTIRQLANISISAACSGRGLAATRLMQCLHTLRPDCIHVLTVRTLVLCFAGQHQEALKLLHTAKPCEADAAAIIAATKGMALQGLGRHAEAYVLLQSQANNMGPAGELARECLLEPAGPGEPAPN